MLKKRVAAARQAAFDVLMEVECGGYASDLLRERIVSFTHRDAGLAGQLVLGSLRVQNQLDYLVERYSKRSVTGLDTEVLIALRLGIYQLRYLDRIPPHAAVNDSVELVKSNKRSASGLANAVLRKVERSEVPWPSEELAYACPEWLLDSWRKHFGAEASKAIASAALQEPIPYVRVRFGEKPPSACQATDVPGCYAVHGATEGLRLHDISSQSIIPLLQIERGHSFLDVCAAPGNKSAQALEFEPGVSVLADFSERRLQMTARGSGVRVVLDAQEQLPLNTKFDRILVDAPCSGTGTLGRNPEIKWRLTEADLERHRVRQSLILQNAARLLSPKGKLLYATCSLQINENEQVIEEAGLKKEDEKWRIPGRDQGDGFYAVRLSR